jgi:hypothetical protein
MRVMKFVEKKEEMERGKKAGESRVEVGKKRGEGRGEKRKRAQTYRQPNRTESF